MPPLLVNVSIHALNEECDMSHRLKILLESQVSIHALNEECDSKISFSVGTCQLFQSTHSMKSATCYCGCAWRTIPVSIHALNEECDTPSFAELTCVSVSIHALNEECDARSM